VTDVLVVKGTDKTIRALVTDTSSVAINLTEALVRFMVKKSVHDSDDDALITKISSVAVQCVITSPLGGLVEAYLVPSDTESMDAGIYSFDFRVQLSNTKIYIVPTPAGTIEVRDRITRAFS